VIVVTAIADEVPSFQDWAQARRHILFMGNLKFAFWRQLPWILMGLAHHNVDEARACCRRALQIFQGMGDDAGHHWVSLLLLLPGSPGHAQMLAFVAGAAVEILPLLHRMAARFKLVPITERWVESRHALIKRMLHTATHASALHVAFVGCQQMLRELLLHRPSAFMDLTACLAEVRNPMLALRSLGLLRHEQVLNWLHSEKREALSRHLRPRVIELIYHVDSATLHRDLPSEFEDAGDVDDDPPDGGGPPPPSPPSPPQPGTPTPTGDPFPPSDSDHEREPPGAGGPAASSGSACGGASCGSSGLVGGLAMSSSGHKSSSSSLPAGSVSPSGDLHDRLWAKYALEFLRCLIDGFAEL